MRVKNKYKDPHQHGDVYVGRGSPWGNPLVIGKDGDRDQVIGKYKRLLLGHKNLRGHLRPLRGKNLVCFCAPQKCHADILLEIANK